MTKQGLQRQFLSGRGSLSHKPFTCRGHRDNNAESLIRKSFSDSLRCNGIFGVYAQNYLVYSKIGWFDLLDSCST